MKIDFLSYLKIFTCNPCNTTLNGGSFMNIKTLLKLEGLFIFILSTFFYFEHGGRLWMFIILLLAPDIFMIGYMKNNIIGARVYNFAHTYVVPGILVLIGYIMSIDILILLGLIWTAHIGMDRLTGYGLKRDSGFKDTHLNI